MTFGRMTEIWSELRCTSRSKEVGVEMVPVFRQEVDVRQRDEALLHLLHRSLRPEDLRWDVQWVETFLQNKHVMESSILANKYLVLESSAGPPDALVGHVLLREDVQKERV